ncbi:hypothetical protein KIN20_007928 [Parelaphostrongylus tenuis]|uniref:Uncharacterized protein n=1 Tax=Parelaphostrongylus tenuis TaxID=148309 RepID=A0AAD5M780_PARTN|nr:hypothetical protein KIN20_007928 [Parelaphostrongylus tenuis]
MKDPECSFIYNVSPVLVNPQPTAKARCHLSTCPKMSLFGPCNCSRFTRNQVVVLENSRASLWRDDSKLSARFSSRKNCNSNHLIENGNEDPSCSIRDLSKSRIFKPKEEYPIKMNSEAKSFQDACTFIDRPPEIETIDAYFAEHPILDYVGNSCAVGTLITMLWYIFDWFVRYLELRHRW